MVAASPRDAYLWCPRASYEAEGEAEDEAGVNVVGLSRSARRRARTRRTAIRSSAKATAELLSMLHLAKVTKASWSVDAMSFLLKTMSTIIRSPLVPWKSIGVSFASRSRRATCNAQISHIPVPG